MGGGVDSRSQEGGVPGFQASPSKAHTHSQTPGPHSVPAAPPTRAHFHFSSPFPHPDDEDWVTGMTPPPLDLSPRGEVRPAPQLASWVTLSTSPDLSDQLSRLKIGVTSAPTLPGCWRREGPQSCAQHRHSTQGPNPSWPNAVPPLGQPQSERQPSLLMRVKE